MKTTVRTLPAPLSVLFPLNLLTLALLTLLVLAHPAHAELRAAGPIDPAHGFPSWYQDENSMALDLCLDPFDGFCLQPIPVPNPLAPVVFPTNFPEEAFWWTADASIALASGGTANLILAMEGAFANEAPNPGDQISFGRIRINMDPPVVGTYTFTHPYGVQQVTVGIDPQTGGPAAIKNLGYDIGATGAQFQGVLQPFNAPAPDQISFGPYLRWDTDFPQVNPANGRLYVGNPNIPHTVTGSPFGTNFFRVEGPSGSNLGGPGIDTVTTPLFAVSGRIIGLDVQPGTSMNLGANSINAPAAAPQTVTVNNLSGSDVSFDTTLATAGANAADFVIGADTCSGTALTAARQSCTFTVSFLPTASDVASRSASILIAPISDVVGVVAPPPVTLNLSGTAQYTVTVNVAGNGAAPGEGSVSSSPAGISCSAAGGTCAANFNAGSSVTLTANAASSPLSLFEAWGDSSSANPRSVLLTVDAPKTLTASFIRGHNLSTSNSAGGSITTSQVVPQGSSPTLTITPDTCFHIVEVTDNSAGVTPVPVAGTGSFTYQIPGVTVDHSVAATFSNIQTVTKSAGAHGSISGPDTVTCGAASTSYSIAPAPKFQVRSITVNDAPQSFTPAASTGAAVTLSIPNISADQSVAATFMPSGDLNADGAVDVADALRGMRMVIGLQAIAGDDAAAMDVAPLGGDSKPLGNGVQDIGDVLLILKRAVGLANW